MGQHNRQRRAAKQRARQASRRRAPSDRPPIDRPPIDRPPFDRPPFERSAPESGHAAPGGPTKVTEIALEATAAFRSGRQSVFDRISAFFATAPPSLGSRLVIDTTVFGLLEKAVGVAWSHGWQPADLGPVLRKQVGARPARIAVDVISHEAQRYAAVTLDPRWHDQLAELGVEVWWDPRRSYLDQLAVRERTTRLVAVTAVLQTLAVLSSLPPLPVLCPRPGEGVPPARRSATSTNARTLPGPRGDGRMLARVRALLAKAESTTFPSEAEALTAKAQELMARHAIDRAMVDADASHAHVPIGRRIPMEDPYAGAKAMLASAVAEANQCRLVYSSDLGFVTVFGHEADVEGVELLFTSLLVQATAAVTAAGKESAQGKRARTTAFRRSFMIGYADRIGRRLQEASRASAVSATAAHGDRLLPVLARRAEAVDDTVEAFFPKLSSYCVSATSGAGWATGQAAAAVASLGVRGEVRSRQEQGSQ